MGLGQEKGGSMGVQPCPPAPEPWSDSLGLWGKEGSALGGSPSPRPSLGLIGGLPPHSSRCCGSRGAEGVGKGGQGGSGGGVGGGGREEEQENREVPLPAHCVRRTPILQVSGEGELTPNLLGGHQEGFFLEGCLELADSGIEPQMSLHVPGRDFLGQRGYLDLAGLQS